MAFAAKKEKPRDYYAGESEWSAVYAEALQELKDTMDLGYLTGESPADVLKIAATDLNNGFLLIGQGKTENVSVFVWRMPEFNPA
ncbi:hypothetical protein [Pseudomonas antarctica]|uniref:hypothetical protein n=1 Tax=Pseudomonas antarctica TaxID=219572 RepID=UPI003F752D05